MSPGLPDAAGGARRRGNEKHLSARQARGRRELGARLRQLREDRGVTLPNLAAAAGTTKGYLSEIESGGRAPSLDLLDTLAVELGTVVAELLGPTWPYGRDD